MAMTKVKIIVEQMGKTAWTWELRDAVPPRLGGTGRIALSDQCFATAERAMANAIEIKDRYVK